jgi:hypothetical protein
MNTQREQSPREISESAHIEPAPTAAELRATQEGLMAKVLEATLVSGSESLSETEQEALKRVVRENPPHARLELAIVFQLVAALLKDRFTSLSREQTTLHQMSMRIAGSLWNHPPSQQHLVRYWELLSKDVWK